MKVVEGPMRCDDAWFEGFYERHHRQIAAYCARRLAPNDVPDATAQVFVVAWKRCADIPDGDRALPWLYGVARRVVSHQWRSAGRSRRLRSKARSQRPLTPPGPESLTVENDEHRMVRQAVMELGGTDREVLLLAAWEGLTHAEIAAVLDCSVAAIDKRAARAKVRLAERVRRLVGTDVEPIRPIDVDIGVDESRSPVRARKGGGVA